MYYPYHNTRAIYVLSLLYFLQAYFSYNIFIAFTIGLLYFTNIVNYYNNSILLFLRFNRLVHGTAAGRHHRSLTREYERCGYIGMCATLEYKTSVLRIPSVVLLRLLSVLKQVF